MRVQLSLNKIFPPSGWTRIDFAFCQPNILLPFIDSIAETVESYIAPRDRGGVLDERVRERLIAQSRDYTSRLAAYRHLIGWNLIYVHSLLLEQLSRRAADATAAANDDDVDDDDGGGGGRGGVGGGGGGSLCRSVGRLGDEKRRASEAAMV